MLTAILGTTLAMWPVLTGSTQPTTDMSLLVAMATMTDVRDSLEEKLGLLAQACGRAEEIPHDTAEYRRLQGQMEIHFRNARDIQALALGFLGTSSQRYADYAKYWGNYRERLVGTWTQIRKYHDTLVADMPGREAAEAAERSGDEAARPATTSSVQAAATPPPATQSPAAAADPLARGTPRTASTTRSNDQQELLRLYREAYKRYSEGSPEAVEDARGRFETLLSSEPAFHLARYWLARILLAQGQPVKARDHAKILLADQPGLKMARTLLAEAERALRHGSARGPATATAMRSRTRLMPFLGGRAVAAKPATEE
ncbi:MAG: tetratricopeptide repeat protein [Candidatus Wallbacteria bacterium]|nr:tetratricopeptide repeat protein [Candidatus Wallbacteria bacterium]